MSDQVRRYYSERLKQGESDNFLWQVGKTVNGQEISSEQVNMIIAGIVNGLQLKKSDEVLDIGCGNGILTKEVSGYVAHITGVELTPELCDVAKKYNSGRHISYINSDILSADPIAQDSKFTKAFMYEVTQHLSYQDADLLFARLNGVLKKNSLVFIGGILDAENKWNFFNTTSRRYSYFKGLLSGNDALGTWYHQDFIAFLAKKHGFHAECVKQNKELYTAHYRFDCVLQRR